MNYHKFPNKEPEVFTLAQTMIGGYTANPADFPHANPAGILTALDNYQSAKDALVAARAAHLAATETKDNQLSALTELMKSQLKLSEVDCGTNPDNLRKIGWSERKAKSKSIVPGQPLELHSMLEGFGTIKLDWQPPPDGGSVRAYLVYRQDISLQGEVLHDWTLVGTALKTEAALNKQPRGIQLSYRVTAINPAGESMASNNVEAVL